MGYRVNPLVAALMAGRGGVGWGGRSTDWSPKCPELAGIDQNANLVGEAAVDLLIGQLQRNERGLPDYPKTTLVGGTWVDGASVRPRR
jgi:LacI family transcriptional regulator